MPVITVMPGHREQSTFVGLQQTLSQLGFDSGSALLKLSFKNSGRPLEEAMTEISQYFRGTEDPAPGAHAGDPSQEVSVPDPDKAATEATHSPPVEVKKSEEPEPEPEPEPMDVDTHAPETSTAPTPALATATVASGAQSTENDPPSSSSNTPVAPTPSLQSPSIGRNVQVYAAPTSATPQAARRAFNEGDYVPTIEHAKSHQAALQAKTRNQRLLSDKELADLENARLEKLMAVAEKGSSVRIRFPDQMMIQTSVGKADTAETLYAFVEQFLQYKEPFQLKYLSPTNGRQVPILRDQKRLIQDLRFTTAELITFVWDEAASAEARLSRKTLAKEWQDQAETLEVKEPVVEEKSTPAPPQSKAEGKKKSDSGGADKESKLRNILGKGLFKR
jgi:tether containing UBX domain for GLUT4